MKLKYRINIVWSDENNCYLVSLPDFEGQQWRTHGDTYEEAFQNALEVMEELHLAALEGGIELPIAKTAETQELETV
jgi:antitoxin HicB